MVKLRKATLDDMDILYLWVNDPVVRNNSFNVESVSYKNHQKWFKRIMNDNAVYQFILIDDKTPVGQIRLNVDGDEAEIGYSIAREYRGKGFGRAILQLIVDEVRTNLPNIKKLVAKVKPDNTVSNSLFKSEGYNMKYSCYILDVIDSAK